MHSFMIKIAIEIFKTVLLVNTTPTLELSFDNEEVVFAEPDPIIFL